MAENPPLKILMADDDQDDRFFFAKALETVSIKTQFVTVNDGEKLLSYINKNLSDLPDVLFLDLNMPRKNGSECLEELKANKAIADFPVVIYSTSLIDEVADELYKAGAFYYMQKGDLAQLIPQLEIILQMFSEKNYKRPSRAKFILNAQELR
jgi:CheY-like chemotaxis protein